MEKRLEWKTSSTVEHTINTDDAKTATVESNLVDTVPFEKVGNKSSKAKHSKTSLVVSDIHSSDNMCLSCYHSFKSKGGLTRHTKSCKMISKVKESSDSEDITLMSVTETQCNGDDEQPNVQPVLVFETDINDADSDVYRKTNTQEQFFWGEK